jgi:hypothetical protein
MPLLVNMQQPLADNTSHENTREKYQRGRDAEKPLRHVKTASRRASAGAKG